MYVQRITNNSGESANTTTNNYHHSANTTSNGLYNNYTPPASVSMLGVSTMFEVHVHVMVYMCRLFLHVQ